MRSKAVARRLCIAVIVLGTTLAAGGNGASAASAPSTVLPDGSVRYDYGRRPTPVLVCKPHFVCDISLDSGENVLNMAIGDSARWVIAGGQSGPSGSTPHVFVKPTQADLETNLVITTTKRVYDVALRSAGDATRSRISFFYADQDAAAKAAAAERQRSAIDSVLAGTPLVGPDAADAKYKLSGDSALMPDKVFNDGTRTFLVWKTLPAELPVVFSIGKDGVGQALNFRVVGASYIVDNCNPNLDLVVAASSERRGRSERRASIRHL